jgi:uncharacterized protein (TIGR00369 family)
VSLDPTAEGWREMSRSPLPGELGLPWARRSEAGWQYGLLTNERHVNPQGVVHGGVLLALADHALSLHAWEAAERSPCTTIQLNGHFLDAVRPGEFVRVEGEVTRRTRTLVFTRGLLRAGGRDVAAVDGIWRILQRVLAG